MSEWALKRFWKEASVAAADEGWTVHLDGRPIKTPAKAALIVPTKALARAIAAEWDAQEGEVDPTTMPFTRSANAAIDKVRIQHDEVAGLLSDYGDSDLLCYRARGPEPLVTRQVEVWDPYLDWAADALGARLTPVSGVMHAPQSSTALAELDARTRAFDAFELAAFHDLVSLTGSLILGFAATEGFQTIEAIWTAAQLDEIWQAEHWGEDEEAAEAAALKQVAFFHAKSFFEACRDAE